MIKYKITYWRSGDICIAYTEAQDIKQARYWFEMTVPNDDIISITEVTDDVD